MFDIDDLIQRGDIIRPKTESAKMSVYSTLPIHLDETAHFTSWKTSNDVVYLGLLNENDRSLVLDVRCIKRAYGSAKRYIVFLQIQSRLGVGWAVFYTNWPGASNVGLGLWFTNKEEIRNKLQQTIEFVFRQGLPKNA